MNGHAELLDARLLTRLERLQLGTRRRLAGVLAGEHRSPLRGSSLEFSDHRPYTPGDDIRRIDPHLYARLDVLMIKLFEAEDDLALRLLVDTSASMGMSGKLIQAARLAAALAAAGRLLAQPGPPGLTVLVSDLLTPEWIDGLDRLPARGGDVAVVHVLGRDDLDPDLVGDLDLVDVEGGPSVAASCSPETLDAYRRHAVAWADEVAGRCRSRRVGYVRVSADDDVESALLGPARMSGILR